MHTNRLSEEKSPYLLQHAHNPVDWYPWGPEAFQKAKADNKPIFLSIGYSTCHWCHVMERESFESPAIAEVLNRYFIPIKVDREERPDVDRIYMTFVQATTGSGGWPMSVWLTPDLKPFFGGTYFPPDNKWGRPGFRSILQQLADVWEKDQGRITESGDDVIKQLQTYVDSSREPRGKVDQAVLDSAYYQFRRSYDSKLGGFGGAPKFPRAVAYNFLFRYAHSTRTEEAAEMVLFTLREMAKGGMNDQLGGGFHRYSVDARWFVPHFEKMLYDQAQLAVSYLEGYQISGDEELAQIARDILDYVLRDMTHPGGGFYSAEDADSVVDPAKPNEKGEGAFYVWPASELRDVLGEQAAAFVAYRFGVEPGGNVEEDPHGEFTGNNILYQRRTIAETAGKFGMDETEMSRLLRDAQRTLLAARAKRIRPHLDDKVLTAWNGLMISAFAIGARVLDEERYAQAARRAKDFILQNLYKDGVLLRRYREGDAGIPGFLDDYAFFVQGLLDLYETSFEEDLLRSASQLTKVMQAAFEDQQDGGFFSTTEGDPHLVMRIKEDYDGAEPSGNSVAVTNLLRLAHMTGDDGFLASAERALGAFASKASSQPTGMPQMLAAALRWMEAPKQIVLAGESDELRPFLHVIRRRFLPNHAVLLAGTDIANTAVRSMKPVNGAAAAYVCENFTCKLPAIDPAQLSELLQ